MPVPQGAIGRRARRRQDVRERIKRAAVELFREKGYEATTVEEIADAADVARGTFFNHFPRKEALLMAMGEDLLDEVEEVLGPPEGWAGTARDQILGYFLELGRHAERDRELFKATVVEQMRHFWLRDSEDMDATHRLFRETLSLVVARGRDRGEVAKDVDVTAAVRLLEGLHIVTLLEWIRSEGSEEELRACLIPSLDVVFRGMQTRDGRVGVKHA